MCLLTLIAFAILTAPAAMNKIVNDIKGIQEEIEKKIEEAFEIISNAINE